MLYGIWRGRSIHEIFVDLLFYVILKSKYLHTRRGADSKRRVEPPIFIFIPLFNLRDNIRLNNLRGSAMYGATNAETFTSVKFLAGAPGADLWAEILSMKAQVKNYDNQFFAGQISGSKLIELTKPLNEKINRMTFQILDMNNGAIPLDNGFLVYDKSSGRWYIEFLDGSIKTGADPMVIASLGLAIALSGLGYPIPVVIPEPAPVAVIPLPVLQENFEIILEQQQEQQEQQQETPIVQNSLPVVQNSLSSFFCSFDKKSLLWAGGTFLILMLFSGNRRK